MKKILIFAIFCLISFDCFAQFVELEDTFYKKMKGKIDKYPIEMELIKIGNELYGNYHYLSQNKPIGFDYTSKIGIDNSI